MQWHENPLCVKMGVMLGTLVLALSSVLPAASDAALHDARLNDLCFLNAQLGWAVGDRGAIWHTDDGGRQWRLQTSGTTAPLHAVWFLDERIGWAAGGLTHSHRPGSESVLLTTRDGGATWTPLVNPTLPALRRIGFFDALHGWAVGNPSAIYPSGVFATDDGGRNWRPIPGGDSSGWRAAEFLDARTGALAGRMVTTAAVRQGQITSPRCAGSDLHNFSALRLTPSGLGWLVGDGGLIRVTGDLGASWTPPSGELPPAARHFDFIAVAVVGSKCWIVGSPGSRIFHSPDGGRSWIVSETGSAVPLRAVAFTDDRHGWAAGELGTILATDDGGQSWHLQRAGGSRAALLGLFAEPEDVPLEWIAALAAGEGYLSVVDVLGRRDADPAPRGDVSSAERLHEAVVAAGGSAAEAAWQFPLRRDGLNMPADRIVEAWDRALGGPSLEALRMWLVRQIRLWRPEAILTHDANRVERDSLAALISKAVQEAAERAADPDFLPEWTAETGLPPWQVRRIAVAAPSDGRDDDSPAERFHPRLGRTPAEAAAEAHGLLCERYAPEPRPASIRIVASRTASETGGWDILGGLGLAPGGPARRDLPEVRTENLDHLQRVARKRRHVQAILERANRLTVSVDGLTAQLDQLTGDLDDRQAGRILYQLADRQYREGRWPLAAELFAVLVERYPDHALTPPALLWLLRYHAGGEAIQRTRQSVPTAPGADGAGLQGASANAAATNLQKSLERALALGQEIQRRRPEMFAEPEVRFPLAAAQRGLGRSQQAEQLYQLQLHAGGGAAWTECARAELRLNDPKVRAGKPTLLCARAAERPRLDGRLDDAVWLSAQPAALQSSTALPQWSTAAPGRG